VVQQRCQRNDLPGGPPCRCGRCSAPARGIQGMRHHKEGIHSSQARSRSAAVGNRSRPRPQSDAERISGSRGHSNGAGVLRAGPAQDIPVHTGGCLETGGAPPYWPWMRVLRGVITAHEPTPLRAALGWRAPALAQLLPELREVWPDVRPLPRDEGGAARHLLFEAIAACLRLAAQDCGLLIHLDDVHRGDESSLLLLRSLASDLAESRILVVAAHRPCAGLPASFRSCLTEWALSDRQKKPA